MHQVLVAGVCVIAFTIAFWFGFYCCYQILYKAAVESLTQASAKYEELGMDYHRLRNEVSRIKQTLPPQS